MLARQRRFEALFHQLLARPALARLVSSAFTIWLSLHPSPALDVSAFNRIRAFIKSCAERLPVEAIEPDAELFALAEQVDLAEKAFHDAVALRNEAQIAYLREPSIITQVAFEGAKTAEAVALEILDAEVSWLASTRATTVIGLKLKASRVNSRQVFVSSSLARRVASWPVAALSRRSSSAMISGDAGDRENRPCALMAPSGKAAAMFRSASVCTSRDDSPASAAAFFAASASFSRKTAA